VPPSGWGVYREKTAPSQRAIPALQGGHEQLSPPLIPRISAGAFLVETNMADQSRADICIVGAGALGIALAQYANGLGARVTLVDRGPPEPADGPGQALRLSALQASAAHAHGMRHSDIFGLAGADPKIRMKAVQERAAALAGEQAVMSDRERLGALGIEIIGGPAAFVDQNSLRVGDIQIRPRSVLLALGGTNQAPAIPGLDQIAYFTPDTILDNNRKLTHLLVIGGSETAVSLAQSFSRLGAEVTLVPQGRLLPGLDRELLSILIQSLAEEGIRVMDEAHVGEIIPRAQGTGALVDLQSGKREALDVSHVLVATAPQADLSALMPEKGRLQRAAAPSSLYVRGPLGETSNRRIRLAGAAAGISQYHHALSHGRAVVEALLFGAPLEKLAPRPALVMTAPPLAQIGRLSMPDGRAPRVQNLLRASLVENEQARALSMPRGLVKVLLSQDGQIVGAGAVGPGAPEMMALLSLAMEKRLALADLSRLSLPHPSLLSAITVLAEAAGGLKPPSRSTQRWRAARRWVSLRAW
jgi:pyruvate/2-oxoglutarate dehydrogenase complex dihydrolipoamide dehydrogenase (E3) component